MFKTVVTAAAAALVTITFGASAYAGGPSGSMGSNGTSLNGMSLNGMSLNGMGLNGIKQNALGSNALHMNGMAPASSSFAIDGIELPAQVR